MNHNINTDKTEIRLVTIFDENGKFEDTFSDELPIQLEPYWVDEVGVNIYFAFKKENFDKKLLSNPAIAEVAKELNWI